jgi:hypothetical protein
LLCKWCFRKNERNARSNEDSTANPIVKNDSESLLCHSRLIPESVFANSPWNKDWIGSGCWFRRSFRNSWGSCCSFGLIGWSP